MPGVSLSSLRVAAEFDASAYSTGMAQKVAADAAGTTSSENLGAALARVDAAQGKLTPGVTRLSRSLIDGYSAASGFERTIKSIGDALDRGLGIDRATVLLEGAYSKFGLVADGAAIAARGYGTLATAVDTLNERLAVQQEIMDRAATSTARNAAATASQQTINERIGVVQPGANTTARGADIAAYGKSLDDLRAKYDPLFAASRSYKGTLDEINQAARVGALTEDQRAAAIGRTKDAFATQVQALNSAKGANDNIGSSIGAATGHIQSLEAVVRHVTDSIAAGTPPLQAFGREIGNLSYGLSGGALKSIGDTITGLLTPTRLAVGALGGMAVTAVAAAASWQSSQQSIAVALTGIGKAAGASVSDINKIAEATSSVSTISIAEARGIATALAETGKVGLSSFSPIIAITRDFATTAGQSVGEASKTLAGAFADPVKGAEELNKRLGFLDDATKNLIASLAASGDRTGAQTALLNAMTPSLGKATDLTTGWAKAWTTVANAASLAFTKIGQGVSEFISGPSDIGTQIEQAQARLTAAQGRLAGTRPGTPGTLGNAPYARAASDVATLSAALDVLLGKQRQLATQAEDTRLNDLSKQVGDLVGQLVPATKAADDMAAKLKLLNQAMATPEACGHLAHVDALALAEQREAEAKRTLLDPITKQTQLLELQVQAMDKRSLADRTSQAMTAKRLELAGQEISFEEKLNQVNLAGRLAAGGQTGLDRQEAQRISNLGELATVADKVRARQLALNDAVREGVAPSQAQQAALLRLTAAEETMSRLQAKSSAGVADDADIRKALNLQRGSLIDKGLVDPADPLKMTAANTVLAKSFESMSAAARTAAAPLESLKKLEIDAGSLRGQLDSTATSSLNNLATSLADISTGSKKAGDAFQNLGQTVVRALEEMLIKLIIVAPLARSLQGALGGFAGAGAGAGGGGFLGGLGFHAGGMGDEPTFARYLPAAAFASAPRFHSGIGPGEVPAIIRRNEGVFTPGQMRHLAPVGAGNTGEPANQQVNIHNYSGGQVQTQRRRSGNTSVTDVIIGESGDGLTKGRFDAPMAARFGIKPKAISR